MGRQFLERYINCVIVCILALSVWATGCSAAPSASEKASSQKEVNGVKIIQTTDAGDDVVTDNNGNQFTVKRNEGSIEIYCLNYKTETTELLPDMEVDAYYYTDFEISEHDFELTLKNSDTDDESKFWVTYTYDIDDDTLTWKNVYEDLGTGTGNTPGEDVKNYLESDNMKSLCNELITTVKRYQQLKDN